MIAEPETSQPRRVIIIDDEPAARAQLRDVIGMIDGLSIVAEVGDGRSAITAIEQHSPDLVFLDIDMPEIDGLGVARATEHLHYQLVFVTAHHQYALEAFATYAIDYLMKPVRPATIQKCVDKILRQQILSPSRSAKKESDRRSLVLVDSGVHRVLAEDHIRLIEGIGRYRRVHLSVAGQRFHNRDTLISDTTLDSFSEQLSAECFLRVHRSYLVNFSLAAALTTRGRRHFLLLEGSDLEVPVSRARVAAVRHALENKG